MKKKIILVMLALALVIGGVAGGVAYAQIDHNSPKGSKLTGLGLYGLGADPSEATEDLVGGFFWGTEFRITNPNCYKTLYLMYVSITDADGNVCLQGTPDLWGLPKEIGPHDILFFELELPGGPPPIIGDAGIPHAYTVELTWQGRADRDLIGWAQPYGVYHLSLDGYEPGIPFNKQVDDVEIVTYSATGMVNFPR